MLKRIIAIVRKNGTDAAPKPMITYDVDMREAYMADMRMHTKVGM